MVDHLMGVPKSTEMTIQDLLHQALRKRGVTVAPTFSASMLSDVKASSLEGKTKTTKGVGSR